MHQDDDSRTSSEILFGKHASPEETKDEINRAETIPISTAPQTKLQTRRQSKGIRYFDRLKPKVQIDIGSLEEWYQVRYVMKQSPAKRRRLNYTTDDIQIELSEEDELEVNRSVDGAVNKTFLYEGWLEDF